jgi:carbon starvation protein CstA
VIDDVGHGGWSDGSSGYGGGDDTVIGGGRGNSTGDIIDGDIAGDEGGEAVVVTLLMLMVVMVAVLVVMVMEVLVTSADISSTLYCVPNNAETCNVLFHFYNNISLSNVHIIYMSWEYGCLWGRGSIYGCRTL